MRQTWLALFLKDTNQSTILFLRGQSVGDFRLHDKLSRNNHYFITLFYKSYRLETKNEYFFAMESYEGQSSQPVLLAMISFKANCKKIVLNYIAK